MPEAKLKFIMRMAMTTKIFCQPTSEHVTHTAYSALLATNQNHYNWAVFMSDIYAPTAIGGPSGHASAALAKAYPNLKFIVQDLPEVIKISAATSVSSITKLATRIKFQPHNFFNEQPVHGADVYLLRMILHDWAFDDAVRIISNIVPILRRRSRIIIMDTVLPTPASILSAAERLLWVRDLTMMQFFNSRERTIEDWKAVLTKANSLLEV
ncbi:hypothetical protein KCU98_g1476, partial [Aureobasidium melanogenum]